jgi:hypothetical protein
MVLYANTRHDWDDNNPDDRPNPLVILPKLEDPKIIEQRKRRQQFTESLGIFDASDYPETKRDEISAALQHLLDLLKSTA